MADVIVTLKIMPTSPDVDLNGIKEKIDVLLKEYESEVGKSEEEPIAFGLKALKVIFVYDEGKGSTEALENSIKEIEGVNSVECTDVRRALG